MRRPTKPVVRGFVLASAALVVPGLLTTPPALADTGSSRVAPAEAAPQSDSSSVAEKLQVLSAFGMLPADSKYLGMTDRTFVFELWKVSAGKREVRASAELALSGTDAECTQWIRTGAREALKRDQDNQVRDEQEARLAQELKRSAASVIGINDVAPNDLLQSYRDFVFWLYRKIPSDGTRPLARKAAEAAFDGTEADQKEFLRNGLRNAWGQDVQDEIDRNNANDEKKRLELEHRQKKASAASVLGIVATDEVLALSDESFVRLIANRAAPDTEVAAAAERALRSSDPADWKAFIYTGIHEASRRDSELQEQRRREAARARAAQIRTQAINSRIRPRLAEAALAALRGTPDDVDRFLRIGQYEALTQSFQATTPGMKGLYLHAEYGVATVGAGRYTGPDSRHEFATWTIMPGLADPSCFSFNSAENPGNFVKLTGIEVQVISDDASEQFRREATWCVQPGLTDSEASLESFASRGYFIRHGGTGAYGEWGLWIGEKGDSGASWRADDPFPKRVSPIARRVANDDALRVRLGDPAGAEQRDGNVLFQDFPGGRMYSDLDPAWQWAYQTQGEVLAGYLRLGGHVAMGPPVTDFAATPDGIGRFNHFKKGASVYWTPQTGAHNVYGAIREKWAKLEWERGILGYPTTDQVATSDGVGQFVNFSKAGSAIYWSPATGEFAVYGAIRAKWASLGAERSDLGYPTSDEFDSLRGRRSNFQHGWIEWDRSTGETFVFRN
ncbi:AbfB domain-containing protein [Amycolatopsis anabasis]|uniref:AbfB domain-containing protein n=1 Tax=Amycolatopsis anabasis TaxID=1840409 RepID=UPI001C552781|nr:AbfB domain-containing protein [Amycolatopsis anabasis]